MSQSGNADASGRWLLWGCWLILLLLAGVVLSTRTLTPVDETRYVGAAWEMWLRGDFLVPFKNGEAYSHKPPFFFWMMHAGWALFGVNEWWPRLVSPLYAAGTVGLVFLLARRLWPQLPAMAGTSSVVLCTTLWWMLFASATMFDVLLAFWVVLGMYGALMAADRSKLGFAVLGVAIGMGVLTKGPVVLLHVLPLIVLVPWWSPGLGLRRWFGGTLLALALGATIALAWALPAGLAGGDAYFNAIFWGQTAHRMVDSFAHKRPFWWYLQMLPLMLFPWSLWPELWRAFASLKRERLDRGTRFCLAWMLPVLLAFSLVSGKQLHYLIPVFPAFAMLAARALIARPASTTGLPLLLIAALGTLLVVAGTGLLNTQLDGLVTNPLWWPGIVICLTAPLAWLAVRRGSPPAIALAGMNALALCLTLIAIQPAIEPLYDIKPLAQEIAKVQQQGATVANLQVYHAQYQFLGRLAAPLVDLGDDPARQREWLVLHPDAYAVVYFHDAQVLEAIPALHKRVYRGGAVALVSQAVALQLLGALDGQRHPNMR